jgi:cellulose synthase/poly-beta-1,6-N-acetylglucosamine synthase-like glycosyltransferase/peptidoglycan/xylan/chitin deacetylase (PgdA/CDA1 family)
VPAAFQPTPTYSPSDIDLDALRPEATDQGSEQELTRLLLEAAEINGISSTPSQPVRIALVNSDTKSLDAIHRNDVKLDIIAGNWFSFNDQASIRVTPDIRKRIGEIRDLGSAGRIVGMLTDEGLDGMPPLPLISGFREIDFRERLARDLGHHVREHQLDGFFINFYQVARYAQRELTDFLQRLRNHIGQETVLGAIVPADDRAWNYGAISGVSDLVIAQAFDQHGDPGNPGPLAATDWFNRVTLAMTLQVPREKLVFSLGTHARDWAGDGSMNDLDFGGSMLLARKAGGSVKFDGATGSAHFSYLDPRGVLHQVYLLDAISLYNQMRWLQRLKPHGLALWDPGNGEEAVWPMFAARTDLSAADAEALKVARFDHGIAVDGKGEIYRFATEPVTGRRTVTLNPAGDQVVNVMYDTLPSSYVITASGWNYGKISLTFDDGPDPVYTPAILDVLREKGVKATFFVIGSSVIRYPELTRRIVEEGHELGNHTFTHSDLTKLPTSLVRLELSATERAVQTVTGRSMLLFRPPYTPGDIALTPSQARVLKIANEDGYHAVGMELDPRDWYTPTASGIAEKTIRMALEGAGSMVLLHDAGGNRLPTVQALREIIDGLRARGFQFATVAEMMGRTLGDTMPDMVSEESFWVWAATLGFAEWTWIGILFSIAVVVCLILTLVRLLLILSAALLQKRTETMNVPQGTPEVTVLIPAYNEEKVIVDTLRNVLHSDYRHLTEILVIDDGSTDRTSAVVREAFSGIDKIRLMTLPNRGKAAALNTGIAEARTEVIITLDADTQLEPDAVRHLARHFADPCIAAVAGNAKVGNRINLLTRWQALEYITGQNLERRALAKMGGITVVPGAIGAWRRSALNEAGGFSTVTLAEDCDLTIHLQRLGYRVAHESDAVAWTEAPDTVSTFMRQRFRWMYGTLQAAYRHRDALFSRKHPGLGFFTLPSIILFSIVLPLISPVMDLVLIGKILSTAADATLHENDFIEHANESFWVIPAYFALMALDLGVAWLAFRMEPRENKRLLVWLPLQRFFYRQVLYIVGLKVVLASLKGIAVGWNKLERKATVTMFLRRTAVRPFEWRLWQSGAVFPTFRRYRDTRSGISERLSHLMNHR